MVIEYLDKCIKEEYENKSILSKRFGTDITKSFTKFKLSAAAADNLHELRQLGRGPNIEKLKIKKRTYLARLNKKYRVEFCVENENIIEIKKIIVIKIHPHNYKEG